MLLYADEDFSFPVVQILRGLGHDVVTAQEDGRVASPDVDILARAYSLGRAVLTYNRRHFERLHRQGEPHVGILSCKHDRDVSSLAARIHDTLSGLTPSRWCLRVEEAAAEAVKQDGSLDATPFATNETLVASSQREKFADTMETDTDEKDPPS